MSRICQLKALQVLDSRGDPTVDVTVTLDNGVTGTAIAAAGKSTGKHEALELRDGDIAAYRGRGVLQAVHNVNEHIAPALMGHEAGNQVLIDRLLRELDGTDNLSNLGSNAVLGVSLAHARAAAMDARMPLYQYLSGGSGEDFELPVPQISIIGGGLLADNPLEFQDFLVMPLAAKSFADAVQMGWNVRFQVGQILREMGHVLLVGDTGGFAPPFRSNQLAIETILRGIERAGYRPGVDVALATDIAASHFKVEEHYVLGGVRLTSKQMIDFVDGLSKKYPFVSIEDPLEEDSWRDWQELTARIGTSVQVVGDDLFVTNAERLRKGVECKAANAILIKLNQIGTVTDTIDVTRAAQAAGLGTVVSVRSGETEDAFISDLVVGLNAGQIKVGSLTRSSRLAKFNRLIKIEAELGSRGNYVGKRVFDYLPRACV
jgi:enolase